LRITRLRPDNGFALIEILIVMFFIAIAVSGNVIKVPIASSDIENQILLRQLEAMAKRKTILLDEEICPMQNCWFNPRGNINKPVIIEFNQKGVWYELVIWLGFGRFKVTERIFDD
jgi:hypothetical protein